MRIRFIGLGLGLGLRLVIMLLLLGFGLCLVLGSRGLGFSKKVRVQGFALQ